MVDGVICLSSEGVLESILVVSTIRFDSVIQKELHTVGIMQKVGIKKKKEPKNQLLFWFSHFTNNKKNANRSHTA